MPSATATKAAQTETASSQWRRSRAKPTASALSPPCWVQDSWDALTFMIFTLRDIAMPPFPNCADRAKLSFLDAANNARTLKLAEVTVTVKKFVRSALFAGLSDQA